MKDFKTKWVLVTGASSGLGAAMATDLALTHQFNLILVARRKENLERLAANIESQSLVHLKIIQADLADSDDLRRVIDECLFCPHFYGAVLNAGMTYLGEYIHHPLKHQLSIIQLNIQATVQLTDAFVKHFEKTGDEGRLMVISSLAAKVPAPYQSVYSGSKAFITNFYHSLKHELQNRKLKLSVFSPGGIKTEMTQDAGFRDMEKYLMPVEEASKLAVKTFINGSHDFIPGLGNRIGIALLSFLPTRIISRLMGKKYYKSIKSNN